MSNGLLFSRHSAVVVARHC